MKTPSTDELHKIREGIRNFSMLANRHPGGSLSSVEAITALFYGGVTELDYHAGEDRDYFVQSKGHAASPLIFTMWAQGLIDEPLEKVLRYGEFGASLPRMPQRNANLGVELGTGSLGQGLSFGLGLAIALRKRGIDRQAYVLLGDGESTEGQVWEAAMTAARLKVRNLVALLDANGSGSLIKLSREEWAARWKGFGWHTQVVDGHDVQAITKALRAASKTEQPSAIILQTVKGKGLDAPLEGSNQLSSNIPKEAIPSFVSDDAIHQAREIIIRLSKSETKDREDLALKVLGSSQEIGKMLRSSPVGTTEVTKKSGGSIATDLSDLPLLFMSTDAIRNSGIMERMEEVGAWEWKNPNSNVLQLAIAEQDAISLCAGVTAGGITGLYFSMEGFYWRGLDQIRQSVAFPQIPAVLVGTSGGVGDLLGPMVQSDRLLVVMQQMIGMDIMEAADVNQARAFFVEALTHRKPFYIRLPHETMPVLDDLKTYLSRQTNNGYHIHVDCDKPDVVLITAGAMLPVTLEVAKLIAKNTALKCRVIEIFSVSRFSKTDSRLRSDLLPKGVQQVSIHNAPSSVLGQFLSSDGGQAVGVDDWGMAGEDLQQMYVAYGLDVESLYRRVTGSSRANEQ